MSYNRLAVEEAREAALHGSMKSQLAREVNADIAERAEHVTLADLRRMEQVAGKLRDKAIDQVARTDRELRRERGLARLGQYVDYVFSVLYGLLLIRLSLALIAASSTAGFVRLIRAATDPFYGMFRGIVPSPITPNGAAFPLPLAIALIVYAALHLAIKGFLHVVAHRRTAV
jgi:hypothetical protein